MNYEEAKQLQTELSAMYETGAYNEKNGFKSVGSDSALNRVSENVWITTSKSTRGFILDITFFTRDSDNFFIMIFESTSEERIKEHIRIAKQLLSGAITWEQGSELIEGVENEDLIIK